VLSGAAISVPACSDLEIERTVYTNVKKLQI